MTAASNSEAVTSAMRALPSRIRSEANISDRPGQLGRLELIATEVEALLVAASHSESPALAANSPNRGDDTTEAANGPQNATQRPAPVDSGAIGRLNDTESELVSDMAGCGCCSSRSSIDKVMPDACPNEDGWVNHSYSEADGCNQMFGVTDVVERILREHTDRALAEVERRIAAVDADGAEIWGITTALTIVRAARQERDPR